MSNDESTPFPVEVSRAGRNASAAERTAIACFRAGVAAALPERVVAETVSVDGGILRVADAAYDLGAYERVVGGGGGKAADGAATALEAILGDQIDAGAVVVDETDGGEGERSDRGAVDSRIDRIVGGHPVPTTAGVEGTARALDLVRAADEDTLVLALVTGGASALFSAPVGAVGLDALRETTDALLRAGADIDEINAVRKHLSRVKGGRLAAAAAPATVVGLVFSDVVGDDLAVIGSGPTAPDASTYADALGVLERYDVTVPSAVRDHLARGERGGEPETPGAAAAAFDRVDNHILANASTALDAAAAVADERGYDPLILSSRLRGEARETGVTHAAIAEEIADAGRPVEPPAVVLSGGETTVSVEGDGVGGPNLECALAAAIEFADAGSPVRGRDCALLAADTDGRDGSTDAAGAVATPATVDDAAAARAALCDNDALSALRRADATLRTGATGTNVNDLRVLVVEA
ncbi:glycerate kinase type-2 family protein [Halobaculum gomorrense]|uniref:Glycerate 2-kinase n=1 Tax=Halobaculum gomorrense TaxID=43928 RepID=A0A1M5NQ47_9EURY|nr:DUF4147 domain-containing protein [Halobaculum gomorrense]SHG91640.1 glycerate 2-kinase [Halobaculum gomorrense]